MSEEIKETVQKVRNEIEGKIQEWLKNEAKEWVIKYTRTKLGVSIDKETLKLITYLDEQRYREIIDKLIEELVTHRYELLDAHRQLQDALDKLTNLKG